MKTRMKSAISADEDPIGYIEAIARTKEAAAQHVQAVRLREDATAILDKSGAAADIIGGLMSLGARVEAEGGKLTAREIQRCGPTAFRGSSELAKMALAAYENMKGHPAKRS